MSTSHVASLTICLLAAAGLGAGAQAAAGAGAAGAGAGSFFAGDAVPLLQAAASTRAIEGGHLGVEEPNYCAQELQMGMDREVLVNNLGGLGPSPGDPVIHIRHFVDLNDGSSADLVISNLTEYNANNVYLNGLNGEFNNINIVAGSVDLLFTFLDTVTQLPKIMPPFNMTIYDLDGPQDDLYAETVSVCTDDYTEFKVTNTTDVIVTTTGNRTNFGSSSWGLKCDNPSSIETVGFVSCTTGPLDQKDRAVALQMKGNQSTYHVTLTASAVAVVGRNYLFGLPAYFDVVCHAPTQSPTPAPTPPPTPPTLAPTPYPTSNVVTSFGDPHVSNLKGERFDILQTDYHTFLVIPRGADEEHALLHVVAKVDPLGQPCSGLLFVTSLRFSGRWMGDIGSLEFTTTVDAAMEAEKTMKIKAGASSYLNASQFREVVPQSLAELTVFEPEKPQSLNQHVDLLLVKLKLGPSIAKVRMVYQKEKVGFSNSLWLTTTGFSAVHEEIGGILGLDDHAFASSQPKKCVEGATGAASGLIRVPTVHGSVHASATFDE